MRCEKHMGAKQLAIAAGVILLACPVLRADTVWIGSGKNAIKVDNIKITQVSDGVVQYTTDSGMTASKTLAQLSRINLDGESIFNTAENAFADRDYDSAISNYELVLQSSDQTSNTGWEQSRAAVRLLAAAKAQNRFDAQVDAYIALLQKDPRQAAQSKPAEPTANSPYLDPALTSISRALDSGNLQEAEKSALLGLQLQIDRAKGDTAQVNATLQQLVTLGSASDADKVMLKILSATVAYDSGKYANAVDAIQQNRQLFTQPDQQVDALFILAQAQQKLAGDNPDPDTLKDQAIAYLRVVTFGNQLPDKTHVPESLYAAAQIEEKLKEPQSALQLYRQIIEDRAYANSPAVAQAKATLDKVAGTK